MTPRGRPPAEWSVDDLELLIRYAHRQINGPEFTRLVSRKTASPASMLSIALWAIREGLLVTK